MMKCGVYQITCIENGLIYIGSSKNIEQRWKNHRRELRLNRHNNMFLQADWNKYGENAFTFEILEQCKEEERYNLEQQYLDKLLPFYRTGKGYNISEKSTTRNTTEIRFFKPKRSYNQGLYVRAKIKGCKPLLVDIDSFRNKTREELIDDCYAMQTYYDLRNYIEDTDGCIDDWDWE